MNPNDMQTPPKRVIAYIDGFNLYFGMKSKGWRKFYWLDVTRLVDALLRPGQVRTAIKYFTSRVSASPGDPDKPKRQNNYLEALATLQGVETYFGHYLQERARCFKCGAAWLKYSEKMTDVNIANEILADGFQDAFDVALLISGDSDLAGTLVRVKKLFPQKRIIVAFPPNRTSLQLGKNAHGSFVIGRAKLAASQLPDTVAKADGFTIQRPAKWR